MRGFDIKTQEDVDEYYRRQGFAPPRHGPGSVWEGVVAPAAMPDAIPEGALLAKVRQCALANGFLFYHTYSSRKSEPGYVDCTIAKPGHPLYLWELKTKDGKLTMEQQRWIEFLSQTRGTEVAVYRPDQWALMEQRLTRRTI
jgi:hypothetical protein